MLAKIYGVPIFQLIHGENQEIPKLQGKLVIARYIEQFSTRKGLCGPQCLCRTCYQNQHMLAHNQHINDIIPFSVHPCAHPNVFYTPPSTLPPPQPWQHVLGIQHCVKKTITRTSPLDFAPLTFRYALRHKPRLHIDILPTSTGVGWRAY